MSLRTSAHTGVAIRFPAEKLCQSVILKANSYPLFRIRPKYCFSFCAAAGVTDCHVASLLAMTKGGTPLHPQARLHPLYVIVNRVLAPAHTYPPSACHCEPVRTLVRQSASPCPRCPSQKPPCTRRRSPSSVCHREPRPCTRAHLPTFSMSLRASAHTGVAIRVPLPTVSVAKTALHPQARLRACHHEPRPCNRTHLPVFSMSLRTSAHTGAAIRSPCSGTWQIAALRANSQWSTNSP